MCHLLPISVLPRGIWINCRWLQVAREGNKMSYLDKNIRDYISNNLAFEFRYEEIFEYCSPYEDKIPEHWYYGQIFDIRLNTSKYKQFITVYYKIFSIDEKRKFENGRCRQMKYHKICIDYPIDSIHYRHFCSAMHEITGKTKCSFQDFKGEIVLFRLEYKRRNEIGKTNQMQGTNILEEWFDESIENEDYEDGVPAYAGEVEVDEYGNYI